MNLTEQYPDLFLSTHKIQEDFFFFPLFSSVEEPEATTSAVLIIFSRSSPFSATWAHQPHFMDRESRGALKSPHTTDMSTEDAVQQPDRVLLWNELIPYASSESLLQREAFKRRLEMPEDGCERHFKTDISGTAENPSTPKGCADDALPLMSKVNFIKGIPKPAHTTRRSKDARPRTSSDGVFEGTLMLQTIEGRSMTESVLIKAAEHISSNVDHTQLDADHIKSDKDHTQSKADYSRSNIDNTHYEADYTQANTDHTQPEADHTQSITDHTQSGEDHTQSITDHTQSVTDHTKSEAEYNQSNTDHTQSEATRIQSNTERTLSEAEEFKKVTSQRKSSIDLNNDPISTVSTANCLLALLLSGDSTESAVPVAVPALAPSTKVDQVGDEEPEESMAEGRACRPQEALDDAASEGDTVDAQSWSFLCGGITREDSGTHQCSSQLHDGVDADDSVFLPNEKTENDFTAEVAEENAERNSPEANVRSEAHNVRRSVRRRRRRILKSHCLASLPCEEARKVLDHQYRMAAELNHLRHGFYLRSSRSSDSQSGEESSRPVLDTAVELQALERLTTNNLFLGNGDNFLREYDFVSNSTSNSSSSCSVTSHPNRSEAHILENVSITTCVSHSSFDRCSFTGSSSSVSMAESSPSSQSGALTEAAGYSAVQVSDSESEVSDRRCDDATHHDEMQAGIPSPAHK